MPPVSSARRRVVPLAIAAAIVVAAAGALGIGVAVSRSAPPAVAAPASTVTPTVAASPTPAPTPTGPAADTAAYDLAGLPTADVFAVNPALPVDDDPRGAPTGLMAHPATDAIPVFAEPGGKPVAVLPAALTFGGTTVPVIRREDNWVRVMLSGRQGTPPEGNPAQLTGWLRAADVVVQSNDAHVEVNLSTRTIAIVTPAGVETVATDFGSGADGTPTPLGRTFIMHTAVVPAFGYTRGNPLIYLGIQSPTLAGFDGAAVAVTALHYHDDRSGAISNGCIRVDAATTARLSQLPLGTPVYITG
ncbi:L,D-transpeptidase [Microbacterium sp. SORGH_AS_0888]|uniref:L,D-transpeptidase n=1 Tax=Microbacterium sp. SORGH_AS_0888 TaxID=3041791 RepID=UPI00278660FF|nr:L,D-transpeptidase [Microbacterium sp. SORGH_AS_0888]MDQ1128915.1 hypothetical protein [Microbacterium sp. SORGH_AS_0888]